MARRGDGIYVRGETWYLDFQHHGTRYQVRLGKGIRRSVAKDLATAKRGELLKEQAGLGGKRRDATFDLAATKFLEWATTNSKPRTLRTYTQCIEALKRSFAGRRLSEISPFGIEGHKKRRAEARVSCNRELAVLRSLFNRCRTELDLYAGANPMDGMKMFKESAGRLRFLDPDEERALLATCREPLRTIILVGIYAGLRVESEALTLQRRDVDLARGSLTVQAAYAKSGKTRSVPLNATLREALGTHLARRDGDTDAPAHVFSRRDGQPLRSIRSAFRRACRRAKLADVTPHTLRHTFASRLVMAGVDLRTVQELGGWSTLKLVERYAHLSPMHKARAVEMMATPGDATTLALQAPGALRVTAPGA